MFTKPILNNFTVIKTQIYKLRKPNASNKNLISRHRSFTEFRTILLINFLKTVFNCSFPN